MTETELNTAKEWTSILSGNTIENIEPKIAILPKKTKDIIARYIGSDNDDHSIAVKSSELPFLFGA